MSWAPFEMVRVHGTFLTLTGFDDLWERVEAAAWARVERERAESAAKQAEFRSRQHGRDYHRDYERERRQKNKQVDASVRCCSVCRKMFVRTKQQLLDGTRFCSRSCAANYRVGKGIVRPARMVTIAGVTKPLPVWAAERGITVGMVYRRMRKGMTDVEALSAPKTKSGPCAARTESFRSAKIALRTPAGAP